MITRPAGTSPHSEAFSGWGWLGAAAVTRVYLLFMLGLAACVFAPMLFGLTASVVQSSSMTPLIEPGDAALTTAYSAEEPIPLGRVVTFQAPVGSARMGLMLHRIVAVDGDGLLVTAGDANPDPDSAPLARADIVGRGVLLVPLIGLPSLWATTGQFLPLGLWMLLTLAALAVQGRSLLSTRRRHRALVIQKRRRRAIGAAVAVVAIAATVVVAIVPVGQAAAAFTSQTSLVGNGWTYPAAAPATRLVFTTNPSTASTGGIVFGTQPVVEFRDAAGLLTTNGGAVTLELTTPNGGILACAANPVPSVHGRSTFAGCKIDKIGTYTLTARSGSVVAAVSTSIVISRGPAVALRVTRSPSATSVAAVAFAVQPLVAITDAGGNTVTTSSAAVTLTLTGTAGATLTCTANPKAAVAGVATFAGCRINRTGTYALVASSGTLQTVTSTSIVITPGAATRLVFLVSPSSSAPGAAFPTQPVVAVQDANGNTVTTSSAGVTLIITPFGPAPVCTANPLAASSGVATFSGCRIALFGIYSLTASSASLTSATSSTFIVA